MADAAVDMTVKRGVGRTRTNFEQMAARFGAGTLDEIASVLLPEETRTDFVRIAVEEAIKRRKRRAEAAAAPKPAKRAKAPTTNGKGKGRRA
jgi:hypothetical protein